MSPRERATKAEVETSANESADAASTERDLGGDERLAAFVASMPTAYHEAFDAEAIELHAMIAHRRGQRAAHIEIWRELPERVVGICVVADDKPGLLSRISAALVAHDVDVVAAQAYGRERDDTTREAVDFLWIRRVPAPNGSHAPLKARDVDRIAESLEAIVRGRASFDGTVRFVRAVRAASESTSVRFESDARDGTLLLTVEAADRPGLLLLITRTLFRERVQIVGSHVTTHEGRARDRFRLTELDGAPLRRARLLALQTAVLAAIEEANHRE